MNFFRDTLYCAVNNTLLEDLVIHIDGELLYWAMSVWEFPAPPLIKWQQKTIDHPDGKMRHVQWFGPDGTKLLEIARYKDSEVTYHWWALNPKEDSSDETISLGTFSIKATRFQKDRIEIELQETDGSKVKKQVLRWLERHWKDKYEDLGDKYSPGQRKRRWEEPWWLPIVPPMAGHEGYTRDDVFDWYHRGGKLFIPEIQGLVDWLGVAKSTVRNLHMNYMAQHPTGRQPDDKSHFAGMVARPFEEE